MSGKFLAMVHASLRRFAGVHFIYAVMIVVAATFVARVLVWPACWLLDRVFAPWNAFPLQHAGVGRVIFVALLFSPVIESAVGQLLVFRLAARFRLFPARTWLTIVLSSVFFGAMHYYSAGYMLSATAVGLVLAAAFAFAGADGRAFWIIAAAHSCINAVAAIVNLRNA